MLHTCGVTGESHGVTMSQSEGSNMFDGCGIGNSPFLVQALVTIPH